MSLDGGAAYAVLLSGFGSNLQALIDAARAGSLQRAPSLIISDKAKAPGLARAAKAGLETRFLDPKEHATRANYGQALHLELDRARIDFVVLAGFMRILHESFVTNWIGRIVNIHPSLLPRYPGLNTHSRVLDSQDQEHGSTIHFVTPELDAGPSIAQFRLQVDSSDTKETLKERVQAGEHAMYPQVVEWLIRGRVRLEGEQVLMDGKPLASPVHFAGEQAGSVGNESL